MKTEKQKSETIRSSKFWRTFMVALTALLTFVGPTYIVYVLLNILQINYIISMVSGFILFVAGLTLMWYLIKSKIIS